MDRPHPDLGKTVMFNYGMASILPEAISNKKISVLWKLKKTP